jgi:hypothetical protein
VKKIVERRDKKMKEVGYITEFIPLFGFHRGCFLVCKSEAFYGRPNAVVAQA